MSIRPSLPRRRNLKELRELEERFTLFVDSVKDYAIFLLDPAGRAMTWNAGVQRVLGYSEEAFIGLEFHRLFRAAEQSAADQEMEKAARDGRSDDERWHLKRDGTEIWVSGVLTALRQPRGRRLRGYAKVMRDTTARKKADLEREGLLRREREVRVEAQRASRVKDEFLAILSHELRTPLNAILGWARMLSTGQLEPARAARAIQIIERNAEAQTRLIGDLLDLSRTIAGTLQLTVGPVNVAALVEDAVASGQADADERAVRVTVHCAAGVPSIEGDAVRLQQMISNLLSNARRFTPPGGAIDVELRQTGDQIELAVRDTGQGIAPEALPHVFERFHQGAGMRRSTGGLGLGLAIVRHIVEAHHGSVEAGSGGEGMGSTFLVRLPVATGLSPAAEASGGGAPAAASRQFAGQLVGLCALVVEDRDDARELVELILRREGMRVVGAESLDTALQAMDAHHIDVIVSDIGLVEDDDGLTLIQTVRARAPERGKNTPAVAVTAYTSPEDRTRVVAAGYQKHVAKPIEPEALVAAIAAAVGGTREPS